MITDREPLSRIEVERLAMYNAEKHRGIVHTPEYAERMTALQERFDRPMPVRPAPPNPGVYSCCSGNAPRGHADYCLHRVGFWRWLLGRRAS